MNKPEARLYIVPTVPWSQWGFCVIYLASSGDATCLNLPSVQMCECECQSVGVCVCLEASKLDSQLICSQTSYTTLTTLRQMPLRQHNFLYLRTIGGGKNLTDKSAAASSEELTRSRRGEVRCVRMKLTVEWDLTREWEAVKHNDTAATMRRREETGAAKWTGDGGQRDDKQS